LGKRRKHIKKCAYFPNINKKNHAVKSDQDGTYNCIAFAAGRTDKKWWPIVRPDAHWPAGVPYTESPDSFIKAFETEGYTVCVDETYVDGTEKVAFFTFAGRVKHAARMSTKDGWLSKLGDAEDISHELRAVTGGGYGLPTVFMERRKKP
jgi:hypothetical protein